MGKGTVLPAEGMELCAFPGVVLLYDNRPCAALGFTSGDATAILSQPVLLLDWSEQVSDEICRQLIDHVKRLLVSKGVQRLQFLQDEDIAARHEMGKCLATHGFVVVAKILQWEKFVPSRQWGHGSLFLTEISNASDDEALPESDVYHFEAAESVSAGDLQYAIDSILECSNDLASMPRPTAIELMAKWDRLRAAVLVASIEGRIIGVIAWTSDAGSLSSSHLSGSQHVCIEYIGVVASFRRQHVARRLISQITSPQRLDASNGMTEAITLRAYSDSENCAATGMYQRLGFARTCTMRLWNCELTSTQH